MNDFSWKYSPLRLFRNMTKFAVTLQISRWSIVHITEWAACDVWWFLHTNHSPIFSLTLWKTKPISFYIKLFIKYSKLCFLVEGISRERRERFDLTIWRIIQKCRRTTGEGSLSFLCTSKALLGPLSYKPPIFLRSLFYQPFYSYKEDWIKTR